MTDSHLKVAEEVLPKILATVRQSVGLAGQDIKFYKSLDKEILTELDETSDRILDMIKGLVRNIDGDVNSGIEIDSENIDNSWKDISDVLDGLFEKSDIAYDDFKRSKNPKNDKQTMTYLEDTTSQGKSLLKRIEKPQLKFKKPIDNSESHPFKPKLSSKPHSIEPFEESIKMVLEIPDFPAHYKQPYEIEIEKQEYPEDILIVSDPIPSKDWHKTEATWVDNVDELNKMVLKLKEAKEIAVDLEHHDYRTYYGIVCLMQISDREDDWIIDTLALRDDLEVLNVVFANPNIIKVFHGAFMDIIWLQRDLGLYIVSLFDTYHASRLLGFPKHSLAYLLETFAHFKTSKKYQLADWRIRPLPDAMLSYARSDTHFLLNIFDQLKNQLIQQDKLKDVLYESRKVSKRRFEYTKYRPDVTSVSVVSPINEKLEPWRPLMFQYNLPESKRHILIDLYNWRDSIARKNDESVRYVMPNQLLISLVAGAPTDSHGVLASGNYIPDFVRINSKEIANIIQAAVKRSDDEDLQLMSNAHDAYEENPKETEIDLSYIQSLHNNFDIFLQKTEMDANKSLIKKATGYIIDSKADRDDTFSLEYKNGKIVKHVSQTPQERMKLIDQEFSSTQTQEIVVAAAAVELPQEEPQLEQQETAEPPAKTDPNEVITLRKNNRQKQISNKPSTLEDEQIFDYSSAKKLIGETKERTKKHQKKRSFDPYSKESEGPRAPKKVQRMNMGKTSSFKNRK